MVLPILCIVAIALITPIAMGAVSPASNAPLGTDFIAPLSHTVGLIILGIVWFGARKDVTLQRLYAVYLPIFTVVTLSSSFLPGISTLGIIFVGDTGYFLVSLFMVTTALSIAHERNVGTLFVYGVFAGFLYLTDAVQIAVRALASSGALDLQPYIVFMLIAYVLAIPVCYIALPLILKGREVPDASDKGSLSIVQEALTDTPSLQSPADDATQRALESISTSFSLTDRQQQVMELLVSGRNAERISDILGLAPNTVKSYRKSLYASLGIHGLQELLDLVETEKCKSSL